MSDLANPKYFKSHIVVHLNVYQEVRKNYISEFAVSRDAYDIVYDALCYASEIDIEDIRVSETFEIDNGDFLDES